MFNGSIQIICNCDDILNIAKWCWWIFVDKNDIANMTLFLLSEHAKNISGQTITVDGNTERMNWWKNMII